MPRVKPYTIVYPNGFEIRMQNRRCLALQNSEDKGWILYFYKAQKTDPKILETSKRDMDMVIERCGLIWHLKEVALSDEAFNLIGFSLQEFNKRYSTKKYIFKP